MLMKKHQMHWGRKGAAIGGGAAAVFLLWYLGPDLVRYLRIKTM